MEIFGKSLIFLGLFLAIVGFLLLFNQRLSFLSWFGNLPGDIKIEKENIRFYFPFISGILLSVLLSLIFSFLRKIF